MAAAAILVFDLQLPVLVSQIGDVPVNARFKFHEDRSIFGRVIVVFVNSRWRPPPFWFLTCDFRFQSIVHSWFAIHVFRHFSIISHGWRAISDFVCWKIGPEVENWVMWRHQAETNITSR